MMEKGKFKEFVGNFGEGIKENRKPLLYIGGALAVCIVGYTIVKGVKNGFSGFFNAGDKVKGDSKFETQPVDTAKATISEPQAKAYANQIYSAMKNAGTQENVIKAIMNGINGEDFKMIYNAFGVRSYYNYGAPSITAYIFGYDDIDMISWFKKEVDSITDPVTYSLIKKRATESGFIF